MKTNIGDLLNTARGSSTASGSAAPKKAKVCSHVTALRSSSVQTFVPQNGLAVAPPAPTRAEPVIPQKRPAFAAQPARPPPAQRSSPADIKGKGVERARSPSVADSTGAGATLEDETFDDFEMDMEAPHSSKPGLPLKLGGEHREESQQQGERHLRSELQTNLFQS